MIAVSDYSGPPSALAEELRRFEAGLVDEATFSHAEHVRLGFEMLGQSSFEESLARGRAAWHETQARP